MGMQERVPACLIDWWKVQECPGGLRRRRYGTIKMLSICELTFFSFLSLTHTQAHTHAHAISGEEKVHVNVSQPRAMIHFFHDNNADKKKSSKLLAGFLRSKCISLITDVHITRKKALMHVKVRDHSHGLICCCCLLLRRKKSSYPFSHCVQMSDRV